MRRRCCCGSGYGPARTWRTSCPTVSSSWCCRWRPCASGRCAARSSRSSVSARSVSSCGAPGRGYWCGGPAPLAAARRGGAGPGRRGRLGPEPGARGGPGHRGRLRSRCPSLRRRVDRARLGRRRCRRRRSTARCSTPVAPTPEMTAQLLFTSGTPGEPKGVAAAHAQSDPGRRDGDRAPRAGSRRTRSGCRRRSPTRPASCTACARVVLGVPQILQPDVGRQARAAVAQRPRRDVRAGRDAVPVRPGEGRGGERRDAAAPADLRGDRSRGAAGPGRAGRRGCWRTDVCGAFGTTETCLGALSVTRRRAPASAGAPTAARCTASQLRITDDDGLRAARRRRRATSSCSPTRLRRLPRPARPDGGGLHRRRLVPHR